MNEWMINAAQEDSLLLVLDSGYMNPDLIDELVTDALSIATCRDNFHSSRLSQMENLSSVKTFGILSEPSTVSSYISKAEPSEKLDT